MTRRLSAYPYRLLVCLLVSLGVLALPMVASGYEAPGECLDTLDNDGDGWVDRDDPDCAAELICTNDTDDDGDGLDDRGLCSLGGPTDRCRFDADCAGGLGFCDVSNVDPDCRCLLEDTGIDLCTANDLSLSFVRTPDTVITDPCFGPDDTITIEGVGAQYATQGGNTRYDIQTWISIDGGDAATGYCSQLILVPATGSCDGGTEPGSVCLVDADCGGGTCNPANPAAVVPSSADLGSGVGPLRNDDGDRCADVRGSDNVLGDVDAVFNIPQPLTFLCADPDEDGYVEVSHTTGWDANETGLCNSLSFDTAPSSKPKCIMGVAQSLRPVPDLGLTCSCTPAPARPGWTSECTVTYTNADLAACDDSDAASKACSGDTRLACDVDADCAAVGEGTCTALLDEDFRCAAAAFVAFDVDYDDTRGSVGATLTSGPGTGGAGGTVSDSGTALTWDPVNKRDVANIISENETGTLTFDYMIAGGATGTAETTVTLLWSPSGAPMTAQSLTASCDIAIDPTYAAVSGLRSWADRGRVVVEWRTAVEMATAGFDLYRREARGGRFERVNRRMLPGTYHLPGGVYRIVDDGAVVGRDYDYLLVETDLGGAERRFGPFRTRAGSDWRPAPEALSAAAERRLEGGFEVLPRAPKEQTLRRLAASRAELAISRERAGTDAKPASGWVAGITEPGLYLVSKLSEARVDRRGLEIPTFASGNGSIFFAEPEASAWTAETSYRVTRDAGRAMASLPGVAPSPVAGHTFVDTVRFERDVLLRTYLAQGPEDDYWHWMVLSPGHPLHAEETADLTVRHPTGLGGASLRFAVVGSGGPNAFEVWLNGVQIGESHWSNAGRQTATVSFDASLLVEGTNTVRLVSLENVVLVDELALTYGRRARAVGDALILPTNGSSPVSVDGFGSSDIEVFDVTSPTSPVRIEATTIDSADGYRVSFTPGDGARRYAVASKDGLRTPASTRRLRDERLLDAANAADYLVIAPESLQRAAKEWARDRDRQGLSTMAVTLEAIMDELNLSAFHPGAIRDFLRYAWENWAVAPRYVLLMGAGHLDFKDALGYGGNLLPPLVVATAGDLVASDSILGDVDSDGVPEILVGRLPILSTDEVDALYTKIRDYEKHLGGAWTDRVLMVADNADHAGSFPADSDAIIATLPGGVTAVPLYLGSPYTLAAARQAFVDEVNAGAGYVNFLGHGSLTQFSGEGMVRSDEVAQLVNDTDLPVVTALTCFIGYFGYPGYQSIGEELLLRQQGGAAAVWGPSGLSFNDDAVAIGKENLIAFLSGAGGERIGDRLLEAYETYVLGGGDPERFLAYNLLGDPVTAVP